MSPFDLSSREAVALAERLQYFWEVNVDVNPTRIASAINATQERLRLKTEDQKLIDGNSLLQLGIEFVEV